jgi:hypothetical protein
MLWARMVYRRGHAGGHALITNKLHSKQMHARAHTHVLIHTRVRMHDARACIHARAHTHARLRASQGVSRGRQGGPEARGRMRARAHPAQLLLGKR